jgi:hypothetical protein
MVRHAWLKSLTPAGASASFFFNSSGMIKANKRRAIVLHPA